MEKSAFVRTPSSLLCPALFALKYPQVSPLLLGAAQSYHILWAYVRELANICNRSCCMADSSTNSWDMTPSVGEDTWSSVPPSILGALGSRLPSGSCVSVKWSYAMQLPPLPQLICADRVMADSSSSLNFREFSVHEEVPMMPALPFVQVIVSLSSDFNASSLTVTVALVAAHSLLMRSAFPGLVVCHPLGDRFHPRSPSSPS